MTTATHNHVRVPPINERQRIPQEAIDETVHRIVEHFQPQLVMLFGSYAYGQPRPESDLDLLVVMDTSLKESIQAQHICHAIDVHFGLDLVVYNSNVLQQRLCAGDVFLHEIMQKGQVLYQQPHYWYTVELDGDMHTMTLEWVDKAEGDFISSRREVRAFFNPNYDSACFHAHQCAEKYLKAFLQEHQIMFPKTHDLIELLALCLPLNAGFAMHRNALTLLNGYAVQYRYPGKSADKAEAWQAFQTLKPVRTFMRQQLGL